MAKFKAPANFGGFSTGGQSYKADKKGFVTLPDGFPVDVAAAHGLIAADGTPEAAAAADEVSGEQTSGAGA
ncbi:hypothetical protein [Trinickia mobilis]|uniref:hypothetical protein n=1 Tax=Trinickia mobilis TaxID=2816356 RepID=UPI001A90C8BF|nr:hypothetical protein [Trinickia mobilis]